MAEHTTLLASGPEVTYLDGITSLDVRGVQTRYYVGGQGDPLMLIHGGHYGFSDSLDMWSLQLTPLSARFRVYALDRLGQGATDNPRSDAEYTFDAAYAHLVDWMRSVAIGRAHVVGHSRGALFAAALAVDHPDLVQTVTLVDTRTLAPTDPRYPMNQAYKAAVREATALPPTEVTARVEPAENSYSSAHISEVFVRRLVELYRLPKTEQAQRTLERIEESVFLPSIARKHDAVLQRIDDTGLSMPTLVVWGVQDPTAQFELGMQLFQRICARTPSAALYALNQAGHYAFREKPVEFNAVLEAFCAAHPIPSQ